jgi:hypothetical protein
MITGVSDVAAALQELARELAEWRLAEYLDRTQPDKAGFTTLKVSHSNRGKETSPLR